MRGGIKVALVVGVLGVLGVGLAVATSGQREAPPSKKPATVSAAKKMTRSQLVGQRIVSGYVGTTPPKSVLRAARAGRIGGVILFSNNIPNTRVAARAINRLQRWAKDGGNPPLLVMIDQEGGIVQRLPQIPPTRSPASIGRSSNPAAVATSQGRATGRALARLGFNVNLAPVVDVPRVRDSFLGNRAYSSNPNVVAKAGCAFAAGNERHGVATSFKHFPGLGRAGADTDFFDVRINASRRAIERDLTAYKRCPTVPSFAMIASARYPKLAIRHPASLEHRTYTMLARTGFKGLTITDALETPQFADYPNAARQALVAGVDVLLWAQAWKTAMRARGKLLADLSAGRLNRARLEVGTERVLALKARLTTAN
jgi:beta-N-acetylhexosaminidase